MQKPAQKLKIWLLLGTAGLFLGCKGEPANLKEPLPSKSGFSFYDTPINYINYIRQSSNLNPFAPNSLLDKAALNHAKYVVTNDEVTHDESEGRAEFSGKTPSDRAFAVGFNSGIVENLSYNAHDIKASIDGLLSAIYHRFGFLTFDANLLGVGYYEQGEKSAYVYEMGNEYLEEICGGGKSQSGDGKFIIGLCKNKSLAIRNENYERTRSLNTTPYAHYPNKEPSLAFFSHELPDPVPECAITANPISIEFHPQAKPVEMLEFRLFDSEGAEIKDTKILNKKSDPNRRFNDKQFALFSKEVFKFDATYTAEFSYKQGERQDKIRWDFTTQTPKYDYFIVSGGENLAIKNGKFYDIFFAPKDCNDEVKNYKTSYNGAIDKPEIQNTATNMLRVRVNGERGAKLEISTDNGRVVSLYLTDEPKNSSLKRKIINLF
ncbi:CAP domain-containing protein [Campylobacter sp. VBCF_05 NA6]|uniref:CAP domain-containing protein n=1 Tax=unclassified Campylobacter TaxID=2593542 RepID=UPI0022EA0EE1|nr:MULTISPECIES: CAP domain-containing protein [unclassified Campylobacter]MDA3057295.1 CAP domain-containing protein [Campylobacter sp. VBCF_04 NA7]MDA3059133.1 CAP domain-containing protein [Campylobacter sp. VBCF_05 NA6]